MGYGGSDPTKWKILMATRPRYHPTNNVFIARVSPLFHDVQVFSSAGLDIVTQSRVEHLPETEKHKHKSINPIQDFLGAAQDHASNTPTIETPPKTTPNSDTIKPVLKMEQYFTKPNNMEEYDGIL